MPILLEEDRSYPLPRMHTVRQLFDAQQLEDVTGTIIRELAKPEICAQLRPGAKVAVAVGSRGIRNLQLIVHTLIEQIKQYGASPFVVSAMGSHGGGTAEGQREVLASYGITQEALGVPVICDIDVQKLGETKRGIQVFFDKTALAADLIIPVNRIKLHTDFVADIQSGLCKMLVIGLGNHQGCSAIHEDDFSTFGDTLLEAAQLIMQSAHVGFGLGIVENCRDQTAQIEAIPASNLIAREKELVKMAAANMPTLMIPEIDVLIVEEIGKNISGAGYDPNILGKSYILKEFVLKVPDIKKMVLLDVSEQSHGNAIGMGIFDVTTQKVYQQLDHESIYANAIAVKCLEDAKIPLVAQDEDEAIRIAIKALRGVRREDLKIVRIKNTLELDTIEVSDALLSYVQTHDQLELVR